MLYRKQLRAIYPTVEVTSKLLSIASDALAFELATSTQFLYLGYHAKFLQRFFAMGVANVNAATLSAEYWDGDSWVAVDEIQDRTLGFTQDGWIAWDIESVQDWEKHALSPIDEDLYWVRISTSATLSVGTTLQAIMNLFCEDELLRTWYPEFISDTRYLPPGRTKFYEQYNAAKELVVQELIRMEAIEEESQVLDIHELSIPATHAAAVCILNGIPNMTELQVDRRNQAMEDMLFWLAKSRKSFDANKDGKVDENTEANIGPVYIPRGGY